MNIEKPNRKRHRYTQHLHAKPEAVFPLLCPVREVDWAPGWMPETVISRSGVCEPGCVFVTPPETPSATSRAYWIVTKHDPDSWTLEMHKVVPDHALTRLEISLAPGPGDSTAADIAYEITALGATGDQFIEQFTEPWYEEFMQEWEQAMNHYLRTGTMIA